MGMLFLMLDTARAGWKDVPLAWTMVGARVETRNKEKRRKVEERNLWLG